jgi:Spy/CpxP family protein refolding chaperone
MRDGGMGFAGPAMMLLGRGQDRALELVQATPQQRADIRRIAGAARDDLRKARQDSRPRREAWAAAWTADRIDAAALEAERARMAAQRDATGKRMVQAMVDVGAVLQPEQRRLLAEHWARHGGQRRAEFMNLDEHAQALVD